MVGADDGRVYVCDRGNRRIQVFRRDGTFLTETLLNAGVGASAAGAAPWDIALSGDPAQERMFIVDGSAHAVIALDRATLEVLDRFGRRGRWAGQFESPHNLAFDSNGNLFVGETLDGRRVQKFIPEP